MITKITEGENYILTVKTPDGFEVEVLCVAGCDRCPDLYVPHYNCLYDGNAVGHSKAHCTANACY